jgi:hypothetical protein
MPLPKWPPKRPRRTISWIDHFSLLPGDASVTTTYNAVNSGIGSGLPALVIHSSTTGENAPSGGNKVVQTALEVPPHYRIVGVRLCYELTNARSFVSQVSISQVQNPPAAANALLDDGTHHTDVGPVCIDITSQQIDPAAGPLLFWLRVNFGDTSDRIAIRGVGLHLTPAP